MPDFYEQIKADQDALTKLVAKIPGFGGYIDREQRRAADKLLRESIVDKYQPIWKRVGEVQQELANDGQLEYLDDLEGAAMKLQTFIDKVRTASYGTTGFFDAIKINEPELARIYSFDLALLDKADDLSSAVDAVRAAIGSEGLKGAISNLLVLSRELVAAFEKRNEVVTADDFSASISEVVPQAPTEEPAAAEEPAETE